MRIAFISYEAPPDTLIGGIGTYVGQAANTLAARGHEVEVFTASTTRCASIESGGYIAHLSKVPTGFDGTTAFPKLVAAIFAERHSRAPFDVLEGPEFMAEAREARNLVPEIPLVIKLHMSMTFIRRLNHPPRPFLRKVKDGAKAMLQPVLNLDRWKAGETEFDFEGLEFPHLLTADAITAPSRAIADITAQMWRLDRSGIIELPNVFVPPVALLNIPVDTATNTVGYVGRMEQRKGVMDLARAIPSILKRHPDTRFLFAGATLDSPSPGVTMEDYLKELIGPSVSQVTFLGKVAGEEIHKVYRAMDIAVFPSLWENFPNTCLEAMAAGRGVVGSSAGGMTQQLDEGNAGLLVSPGQSHEIVKAVCRLLEDPELRKDFGRKARARMLAEYNMDRVGQLMEDSYERAIRQHRQGKRQWQVP